MNSTDGTDVSAWRRRVILAVLLCGTFMLLLDSTIVNVALPPISADLEAGYTAIQWVVSAYTLAFGLFLLPAGWLGDRIGHKWVLAIGLGGFTIASVLCGVSVSAGELVAWRVAQGVSAAGVAPSIMAMIRLLFAGRGRARAFAAYGAVAGVATALGPLLGGLLIQWDVAELSWRPIFLVNIPVGIVAVAAVVALAPQTGRGRAQLDLFGLLLIVAALFTLAFPLTEGSAVGWPVWTAAMLTASAALFAMFAWWQLRRVQQGRDPLLDVRMFANRSFAAGVGVSLSFFACFVSLLFALSLYLQIGLQKSPLYAGLSIMPFAFGTTVGSTLGNAVLAPRWGRRVLHWGAVAVAVGIGGLLVLLSSDSAVGSGWELVLPLFVGGVGSGMIIGPNVNITLSGVAPRLAGVASGTLSTAQRIGPALGIAVVGIVLFGTLTSGAADTASTQRSMVEDRLTAVEGVDASAVGRQFERCVVTVAAQQDPSSSPAVCEFGVPGPQRQFLDDAVAQARAVNYTKATRNAAWFGLAAITLTWFLVFGLPRRSERDNPA